MNRLPRYEDSGFTVVEFVIAATVLFVVAMGVFSATTYVVNSSRSSSMKVAALNLANEKIESIRNLPYDKVGLTAAGGPVAIPGVVSTQETIDDYNVETDISWARDEGTGRALYKIVQVSVDWNSGIPGSISVASNVFGKSDLVNTGDLSVTVVDWATGDPIPGVYVTATYEGGTIRGQSADSEGEAFFGYLPTGDYTIDVQKAGYIWDEALLSATTVAPDLLTNIVIEMQTPRTLRVIVEDSDGSSVPGADVVVSRTNMDDLIGVTNASGMASFADLVAGQYGVHVSATGRASADVIVPLDETASEPMDVTVVLPERVGLVVQAVTDGGAPVSGASVSVFGPYPSMHSVSKTTSTNGEVSFGDIVNGRYWIVVSKSGLGNQSIAVDYDGLNSPVVVTLSPMAQGSIKVRTMENQWTSRPGERIALTGPDGYFQEVVTDSWGYFTFEDLAVVSGEDYTIDYAAKYRGNGTFNKYMADQSVTVSPGQQTVVTLEWR
ncbi:MAG: carboxypeptidase regulatory-like domain-containing protein [Coriobacteriia bacterium]|nr:carboxypeptidase regulatory-like domain-containing protein [Coriobacteriia bacterium]